MTKTQRIKDIRRVLDNAKKQVAEHSAVGNYLMEAHQRELQHLAFIDGIVANLRKRLKELGAKERKE